MEEKRGLERSQESDLELFKGKCTELKSMLSKMRSCDPDSLDELKTEVALTFLDMKQLNRFDKYRGKALRDDVFKGRAKVDNFCLKLQNLLYEVTFLEKEIMRSLEYPSRAEEVDLVDVETFFRECSLEKSSFNDDKHTLTLRRLEYELKQRIKLAEEIKESSLFNNHNLEEVRKMMELLSRLRSCMTVVVEALKPVTAELVNDNADVLNQEIKEEMDDPSESPYSSQVDDQTETEAAHK